jgi:Icc-related predicted phosphoesterase
MEVRKMNERIEILKFDIKRPIKIIALSDIQLGNNKYNNEATLRALSRLRESVLKEKENRGISAILLLAGDIIEPNTGPYLVSELNKFLDTFDLVFIVRGNHDSIVDLSKMNSKKIYNIEFKIIELNSGQFFITGYYPVEDEALKTEFFLKLKDIRKESNGPIIIVSHWPPYGILDLAEVDKKHTIDPRTAHQGDKFMREICDEIENYILICGHLARQGGNVKKTEKGLVFNVADFGCKKGRELKSFIVLEIEIDENVKIPRFTSPPIEFENEEEFIDFLFEDAQELLGIE